MEQQIRFCTTSDDVRIAYSTAGEGPPVIVVPGWVSHQEITWQAPQWQKLAEDFVKHFLFVSYDKRGTGLSDRGVKDYSIDARLRDLEAVVDSLGVPNIALFGMSEGGPVLGVLEEERCRPRCTCRPRIHRNVTVTVAGVSHAAR